MFGIYVNESGCIPYADAIASGAKTIETRSRNVLKKLVGENVAIIKTKRGKSPVIVGHALITRVEWCSKEDFQSFFNQHLVPVGSQYDATEKGKYLYYLHGAKR